MTDKHNSDASTSIGSFILHNPISLLQELCARQKIPAPLYEQETEKGSPHKPQHTISCEVLNYRETGVGPSKKVAKRLAADKVLQKLQETLSESNTWSNGTKNVKLSCTNKFNVCDHHIMTTKLCVICGKVIEKDAKYPDLTPNGIVEFGTKWKKIGINAEVLERVDELKFTDNQNFMEMEAIYPLLSVIKKALRKPYCNSRTNQNTLERYAKLKDANIPKATHSYNIHTTSFFKSLKDNTGAALAELQVACLNDGNINYIEFLQSIADHHEFKIVYTDMDEKTSSGRYQCLVKLTTLPVAICQGTAATPDEARFEAAHNALEYLKMTVKK